MENSLNELAKKMQALAGIKEGTTKFLKNEEFTDKPEKKVNYTTFQFPQEEVEPGEDDEKLYSLI